MKRLAALLLALAAGCATAQTVYRCGNSYSQEPCPGGQAMDASDTRTPTQRAEAMRVAAEDRRRAAEMARERRADAAAAASVAKAASAPAPKPKRRHKKPKTGPVKPI